jgi:hypothetical protein
MISGRIAATDDATIRARRQAQRLRLLGRHHEHRGGAVVERAGVARGDRALRVERRLELRQHLDRRAGPRAVVLGHLRAVGERHRHDLGIEVAVLDRRHRPLLRDRRPLVLRLARHVAALGDVLRRDPHRDVDVVRRAVRAVELRVRVDRRVRGVARDGLGPGRDVLVALAGLDRVESHPQRLQRGGAEAADRHRGDVMVDAGEQLGVAADVVALLAHREAAAHQDVVGLREVDLGVALDERLQGDGGEVVGADVLERALGRAADRGADRVDDDGVGHGVGLLFNHLGARMLRAQRAAAASSASSRPGKRASRSSRRSET